MSGKQLEQVQLYFTYIKNHCAKCSKYEKHLIKFTNSPLYIVYVDMNTI